MCQSSQKTQFFYRHLAVVGRDEFAVIRLWVLWPNGRKPKATRVPVVSRGL